MVYFSVLVYSFNRREYILEAVKSVLKQEFDKFGYEIIVIKGFVDESLDEYLQKNNVKNLFLNDKSLGAKLAYGIQESSGEFICFLDDDDLFEPNKLDSLMLLLKRSTFIDFIHNSLIKIDENGRVIDSNPRENTQRGISYSPNSNDCKKLSSIIKRRGDWYLSSMCIRKSVIFRVIQELSMTNQSVDKFIFFAALNYGRNIQMIPDKLTRYRLHKSTTTYAGNKDEFIRRRETFFINTVNVSWNIMRISTNLPGCYFSKCQFLQHKLNLYFISGNSDYRVSYREFLDFVECLGCIRTRFQIVWILAFILRRISLKTARMVYYGIFNRDFMQFI